MNVGPRQAREMLHAIGTIRDFDRARAIYYDVVLPLVDVMFDTCNPTGTIKAGLAARGVDVGVPRRPGSTVSAADAARLAAFAAGLEDRIVRLPPSPE